ncbi:hypothetical protein AYL99_10724 [Fonsecaea erecta]|uniref:Uncharacterized protein n=1 Tax=Fonsecaea erecta TaxID=1367422 RepID=A0A178Z5H9_9EURO|nr:hypothetical protein AYL99_10724 [Fonsecaea erecta]OAP55024.1 hypothetical protein AYL99_10724 [Fonsecaea erecta]
MTLQLDAIEWALFAFGSKTLPSNRRVSATFDIAYESLKDFNRAAIFVCGDEQKAMVIKRPHPDNEGQTETLACVSRVQLPLNGPQPMQVDNFTGATEFLEAARRALPSDNKVTAKTGSLAWRMF